SHFCKPVLSEGRWSILTSGREVICWNLGLWRLFADRFKGQRNVENLRKREVRIYLHPGACLAESHHNHASVGRGVRNFKPPPRHGNLFPLQSLVELLIKVRAEADPKPGRGMSNIHQ